MLIFDEFVIYFVEDCFNLEKMRGDVFTSPSPPPPNVSG
jgi:hypothetical protein